MSAHMNRPDAPVNPLPWPEFTAAVLALYEPPLRARSTQGKVRWLLGYLAALGASSTSDLTTATAARFVAARSAQVCVNTLVGDLSTFRAVCGIAVEEGWLARNPFDSRRLRVRPEEPAGKRHHPLADLVKVLGRLRGRAGLSWNDHRLYAAFCLAAFTGLRKCELLALRVEDVDLGAGLIRVVARRRLKTAGSAQPVPIPARLAEVLADWIPVCGSGWLVPNGRRAGPWTGGNAGYKALDRLKEAGRAVGVDGLTFQSLRHSWATHAESAWGLAEGQIQRVLRHTRPLTSRHYRHADAENLRRIAERVAIGA